jgi:hypothetical protein
MTRLFKATLTSLGLALGFLTSGATAHAAFNVDGFSYLDTSHIKVTRTGTPGDQPTFSYANNVGVFAWSPKTSFPDGVVLDANGKLRTFCIEIPEHVSNGPDYLFTPTPLTSLPNANGGGPTMTQTKVDNIAKLWEAYRDTINGNAVLTTAFQVSIWAIVYGNGSYSYNADVNGGTNNSTDGVLTSGLFKSAENDAVNSKAHEWLTSLSGLTDKANLVGFKVTLGNANHQDQISEREENFDDGLQPVPAPPAVILALVGIVPCLAMRRRLRGQAA